MSGRIAACETEALRLATREDGSLDVERYDVEYKRALSERQEKLAREAQALVRPMEGRGAIESAEAWDRAVCKADEDLQAGSFLIERLGGSRFVDPELTAVLLVLRRHLIDEHGANTAAELMMIDATLLAYAHMLRITSRIGNLAVAAESEFFGRASLTAKLDRRFGPKTEVRGLRVEELLQRLSEDLMPLLDRSNRMMLRNLKALKEHRRPQAPNLSINQAQQVNVGGQHVNLSAADEPASRGAPATDRPSRSPGSASRRSS